MSQRPNILFIMTDEQKYDTFSCINPTIKTPYLDDLIQESVFFTNGYCTNPSCIPSRAAIMTGKYPTACQCPTYISKLPEDEVTFMKKLQESGYCTAVVGKQHFAGSTIEKGYDYEFIVDGHSPNADKEEITLYTEYLVSKGIDPRSLYEGDLIVGGHWKGNVEDYIDSFVGEQGKSWLENHIKGNQSNKEKQPWFLNLSFPGPHQPFDGAGTGYEKDYDLKDMNRNESCFADLDGKPPHYKKLNPKAYIDQYPDEKFRETKRSYYATMSLIDEKIGEVVKLLKETGEFDNTLIIYTADHGDFMGDYGMVTKAQYLCQSLMRVPFFIKPPLANFSGKVVHDDVSNVEIASTALVAAESAEKISENMENHPLQKYWSEESPSPETFLYMEAHNIKGVIVDQIKTIYYVDRPYGELYDLKKDPLERMNLWEEPSYQGQKCLGLSKIIDKMFQLSPKSEMRWNTHAPEI